MSTSRRLSKLLSAQDTFLLVSHHIRICLLHVTNSPLPGIGFSDDPLLQGRNFSYQDTQLSRIGINFQELPINRPVCPVMNNNR